MVTKFIKLLALTVLSVIIILSIVLALNQLAANNPTNSSPLTPTSTAAPTEIPTTDSPTNTPTPSAAPIPTSSPTTPPPLTVVFDFETATPQLVPSMSTPLSQTKDGITAQFSSPSDPAGFSVQSYGTTFYKLSQFQENYISDNKPSRDTLEIRLSQPIKDITFTFATLESEGGPTSQPSNIMLTAYMDSTANQVGSTTARGTWPSGGDAYPQGTLTFNSANSPFNLIRIELPYQGQSSAVDYLIDTLTLKTS